MRSRCLAAIATIAIGLCASSPRAHAAPDGTLGMALMGAYLAADGTVRGSSGVVAVSKEGTGNYYVTFERDVSACILSGVAGQASLVYVTAYVLTAVDVRQVRVVAFYQSNGSAIDVPVHLMVFCPK